MAVPLSIRQVPRPAGTTVYTTKDPNKYGVRTKLVLINENGKKEYRNGPIIGHIIDGVYIDIDDEIPRLRDRRSAVKDWAVILVLDSRFKPMLYDLKKEFNRDDALMIYCMALLMAAYPGIKFYEMKEKYEESYLRDLYPNVALCPNTISEFLECLGKAADKMEEYLKSRVEHSREGTKIIVDGTVLPNTSSVNTLAEYNYKKGEDGINMLVAYDATNHEALSFKLYSGNMTDTGVYADFLEYLAPQAGLIIGDKAFIESVVKDYMAAHPLVHFLYPLKRNSGFYEKYDLDHPDHQSLKIANLLWKKVRLETGEWLYAFCDLNRKYQEIDSLLLNLRRADDDSLEKLDEKESKMGTVVFVSDLDLDPTEVYLDYRERWCIEVVIRFYKQILQFKTINVHDDFSILGETFIRFISFIGSLKLNFEMSRLGLLKVKTYDDIMKLLRKARRTRDPQGHWNLVELTDKDDNILATLGVLPQKKPIAKPKRGRPRKNPEEKADKKQEKKEFMESKTSQRIEKEQEVLRKFLQAQREQAAKEAAEKEKAKLAEGEKPKKKRGRKPGSKNKTPEQRAAEAAKKNAHKKKRGRPPKDEIRKTTEN